MTGTRTRLNLKTRIICAKADAGMGENNEVLNNEVLNEGLIYMYMVSGTWHPASRPDAPVSSALPQQPSPPRRERGTAAETDLNGRRLRDYA